MSTFSRVLLVAALALGGCKKDDKKGEPADKAAAKTIDAGAVAKTPADAAPAPAEPEGEMAKKAGNCPSTVAGAKTKLLAETTGGVSTVEITSADALAVPTIRSRTKHLVEVAAVAPDSKVEHTGKGTGGGDIGICPVITKDTKIVVEEIEGGVKVTMTPQGDLKPLELYTEVEQRIVKADAWTAANIKQTGEFGQLGGDGGGKGGHGANRSGKGDASGPREGDKPDGKKDEAADKKPE
jgi:hypothetical protein